MTTRCCFVTAPRVPPTPVVNPDIGDLAGLVGTWTGSGHGDYPTIDPFDYLETATFGVVPGKPFVTYAQRTSHPESGAAMHSESGYVRSPARGRLELVVAQPTGITEVHTGDLSVDGDDLTLTLATTAVVCTPTAKDVTAVERRWRLRGDTLSYEVSMAAVGQPMALHLRAHLERVSPVEDDEGHAKDGKQHR
jgi:hypothetical protein